MSPVVTNPAGYADRDLGKIPSRIASPSTNGPRLSTAEPRAAIWEGDLIICKRTRPVLVLHERKSRVTRAARLTGKTVFARIERMVHCQ
jgi:IS30 family transposase